MASGFFALLDDIAILLDDVASMSKIATKKTAGILGDDLAVNAEKASGFLSSREIPVLWAITKGSFVNKLIILPTAFLLSAFFPIAITVILVLGALYLAYEGAEKIYGFFFPHHGGHQKQKVSEVSETEVLALEKKRVKEAIFTDFILSVEIVIIALGTVLEEPLTTQIIVVSIVAIIATIGVYGIVALIVRMDEFGLKLINLNERTNSLSDKVGRILVQALPIIVKALSVIGTIALLLVAGGILVHKVDFLHHVLPQWPEILKEFLAGLLAGFLLVLLINAGKKVFGKEA
ncbi:MAG: DUF808 domain-containing protein [Bacteroidota bacterium]